MDDQDLGTPPPPPPAPPVSPTFRTPEEHLHAMADKYRVDPELALAILRRESNGRQTGPDGQPWQSSQGAQGMFQLLPTTAQEFGLDPTDPFQNIEAGVRYLRQGIDRGDGSVRSVASYYHGGPNRQLWGPKTSAYAQAVEDDLRQRLATAPAAKPAARPAAKSGDWAKPENIEAAVAANPPGPPAPPWYQRAASTVAGTAADVGIGVAKGAGQTATNLGALVHKIPGVDEVTERMFHLPPGASQQAFAETNKTLEPSNTTQTVGKVGEQIAEMVVPGSIVAKEAKAAQAFAAPALTRFFGQTAANVIPRVAVEAAGGAGMATAQGGDPATGAAFGAAAPVVGDLAGAASDAWAGGLRDKAGKLVEQAFGATGQRYKAMVQKRVQEILARGLTGGRDTIVQEARTAHTAASQAIDDIMYQHGTDPFTGSQRLLQYLETVKDKFRRMVPGPQGPTEVILDQRPYSQLTRLQQLVTALGPQPTMADMVAVRKVWDNVVQEAGGFAHRAQGAIGLSLREQTEEWAKSRGANFLRGLLGHDLPDLVKPNHEFSFWKDIDDALTQTMQRTGPQGPGLGRTLAHIGARTAGAAAAAMGIGAEHAKYTVPGLAVYGLAEAGNLAHQVMTSPRWRMASAQLRHRFADALTGNDTGTLAEIATLITGTRVAAPPPPPPQGHDISLPPPPPRELSVTMKSDPRR